MNLAQQELLDRCPDINPADIPKSWNGAADLDQQEHALRQKRLAAESTNARPLPAHITTKELRDAIAAAAGLALHLAGKEIEKLENRVAELEARPVFDYTGVYEQGRSYRKGQACTHGGSIFVAMKDYPSAPGTPDCGFQLACKRGRDGKDGRVARKSHALA